MYEPSVALVGFAMTATSPLGVKATELPVAPGAAFGVSVPSLPIPNSLIGPLRMKRCCLEGATAAAKKGMTLWTVVDGLSAVRVPSVSTRNWATEPIRTRLTGGTKTCPT